MKCLSFLLLLVLSQAQVFGANNNTSSSSSSNHPILPTKQRLNEAKQAFDNAVKAGDQVGPAILSAFLKDAYLPAKNLLKQVNATLAQCQRYNVSRNAVNTAVAVLRGFVDAYGRLSIQYNVPELSRFGGYVFPELLGAANILAEWYKFQQQFDEAFKMHFIAGSQVCRRHMSAIHDLKAVSSALQVMQDHLNVAYEYKKNDEEKLRVLLLNYWSQWANTDKRIKREIAFKLKGAQKSNKISISDEEKKKLATAIKQEHVYNRFKGEMFQAYRMILDIVEGEIETASTTRALQEIGKLMKILITKMGANVDLKIIKAFKGVYENRQRELQLRRDPRLISNDEVFPSAATNNTKPSVSLAPANLIQLISSSQSALERAKPAFDNETQNVNQISEQIFRIFYQHAYKPSLSIVKRFNNAQRRVNDSPTRNEVNPAARNVVNFLKAYAKFESFYSVHNTQVDVFIELLRASRELATYYKKKGYLGEELVQHYRAGAKYHKKYLDCRKTLVQNVESLGLMLEHLKLAWDTYRLNKAQAIPQLQKSGIDLGAFKNELEKAYLVVLQYLKNELVKTDDLKAFEDAFWPLILKMGNTKFWYADRKKIDAVCALLNERKQQYSSSSSSSNSSTSSSPVSTSSSIATTAVNAKSMKRTGQLKRFRTTTTKSHNLLNPSPLTKHTTAHNNRNEMLSRVVASPPLPNEESSSSATMQDDYRGENLFSFADMHKERVKAIREQRAQHFATLTANYKKKLAQHAVLQKTVTTMNDDIKHKEETASRMAGILHANRERIKKIEQELIKLKDSVVQSEQVYAQKRQNIEALRLSKKEKEADVTKYERVLLIDSFRSLGLTIGDSHYDILAVTKDASMQEVKNAYAALVQRCENAGIGIGTSMRRLIDQARVHILKSKK